MKVHKKRAIAAVHLEDLFPARQPVAKNPAAELLQSRVIEAFETALGQGITPYNALSVVLEWASTELNRVHSDCPGHLR
jgi:hypothetical protein